MMAYERGELAPAAIKGRSGRCHVIVKPAEGSFPSKNAVKDYFPAETGQCEEPSRREPPMGQPLPASRPLPPAGDDEDIPF